MPLLFIVLRYVKYLTKGAKIASHQIVHVTLNVSHHIIIYYITIKYGRNL